MFGSLLKPYNICFDFSYFFLLLLLTAHIILNAFSFFFCMLFNNIPEKGKHIFFKYNWWLSVGYQCPTGWNGGWWFCTVTICYYCELRELSVAAHRQWWPFSHKRRQIWTMVKQIVLSKIKDQDKCKTETTKAISYKEKAHLERGLK